MGQSVAKAIAVALQNNKVLTVLKLKHPSLGITPDAAKAFAAMLKEKWAADLPGIEW